jgi:hypothetical protein
METLKKLSVVTNNFEELKEKVLELTKNDFSWALECNIEDKDGHVVNTKLLILSDFKYDIEDEDSNYKALTVKVTYERYLADVVEDVSNNVQIIFYQHNDKLFKDGIFEIQTRDKNIFNAFYTLFEEMELL